jgi:hypothetical protein
MIVIFFIKDKTSFPVESKTKAPAFQKPTYSGSRFAQDAGKGSLFHYASNSKGDELPLQFAIFASGWFSEKSSRPSLNC